MKTLITFLLTFALFISVALCLSDLDLQAQSGQLWPDIVAYGDAKAKDATVRADKLAARQVFLDKLLVVATAALNSGDLSEMKTLISTAVDEAKQTDAEIKIAELRAVQVAEAEAAAKRAAELQAEIDALESKN